MGTCTRRQAISRKQLIPVRDTITNGNLPEPAIRLGYPSLGMAHKKWGIIYKNHVKTARTDRGSWHPDTVNYANGSGILDPELLEVRDPVGKRLSPCFRKALIQAASTIQKIAATFLEIRRRLKIGAAARFRGRAPEISLARTGGCPGNDCSQLR